MRLKRYVCFLAMAGMLAAGNGQAQNQLPPGTQDPDSAPTAAKGAAQSKPGREAAEAKPGREAAETKIDQHDFEAARPLLQKYLSQNPGDARALFDLGYVEDAGGHDEAAAADYRKAIAVDPNQFEAHLALGLLLAHQAKFDLRSPPTPPPRQKPTDRWPSWTAAAIHPRPGTRLWLRSG
jgi:tetratricopeptide (TPR) repeat protein